jgi:hypothetical protein
MSRARRKRSPKSRWFPLVVSSLAALIVPTTPLLRNDQPATAQQAAPPAAPQANPLDQPLQLVYEARKAYANVQDYSCTLVKQERVQGRLQEQNIILCKFRVNPFSVNMRWLAPRELVGQEVSFIYGRNGNKMHVNFAKGFKKVISPWIDPLDPRVLQHSRHNIYEAGIGNLIEMTIKNMEMERNLNKTQVRIADYTYNNRPCYRIESVRTERNERYYSYRSVLYLDKETKLPIRTENYDWPTQGGAEGGDLLEVFSFIDLRTNAGLTDADFAR